LKVLREVDAVARLADRFRAAGLSIGFVPTMGALHAGHLALVARARAECERVIVSIFVNPTQFAPGEDFDAYPRPLTADIEACREAGVDLVFCGEARDLYPPGFQTWVAVEELAKPLCGPRRPGHFRGVATIVSQLLSIVRPHRAYFGRKDYQQCLVVARLVTDLHLGTEVRTCETVRESDGLAMSSRNARLSPAERTTAARIHRALAAARETLERGEGSVESLEAKLRGDLERGGGLEVEYAEALDAPTLAALPSGNLPRGPGHVLLAVAARAGKTRLIDNLVVEIPARRGTTD
jgi:pantoate--beta-alanine ligase